MSIDRRKTSCFYFVCEQHLAEICRHGVDVYGELFKQDYGVACDVVRCPLPADFEYFPSLNKLIKSIKIKDLKTMEI